MNKVVFLADHPEVISILVQWALAWAPEYYGGRTVEDIAGDFQRESQKTGIPIRLVAFLDGELAGMVCLREMALQGHPEYSPVLGGLYVPASMRNRGVATALVRAVMDLAKEEGYQCVYTSTATAKGIMERLGWQPVQTVREEQRELMVYVYEIM